MSNNKDLISIIVPVYNAEKTLERCINSIISQTYENFELLLIDDGSKDSSPGICDNYSNKDNRIKVIHIPNNGVSNARNTGISNSIGEYICFVDSDDYVECDYIELLLSIKNKFSDIDNIWCSFNEIISKTGEVRINSFNSFQDEEYTIVSKSKYMTIHEKWLDPMPWNKLYKASIVKDNNILMNKSLSLGEDLLFNLEYLKHTEDDRIIIINKPLVNYISDNAGSLDNKYYDNLLDIYNSINLNIKESLDYWNADDEEKQKFLNMKYFSYERVFINTFKKENKLSFFKKLKYNKSIILSTDFEYVIKHMNYNLPQIYKLSYKLKSYLLIYLYDKLAKLIKRK